MSSTVKEALDRGSRTDLPQLLGRMNIGQLLEQLVTPTIDSSARTVTTHVCLMEDANEDAVYGLVLAVEATAGGVTGACLMTIGTPATHQVKVEYLSTGQPKLTFAAGDAVTACKVYWIEWPKSRNNRAPRAELEAAAP